MRWKLTVGQVRTSDEQVLVLIDGPDFFAVEIDLDTKYAEVLSESYDDESVEFTATPGEYTLRAGPRSAGVTTFSITRDLTDFYYLQHISRYTWRIVGYRHR